MNHLKNLKHDQLPLNYMVYLLEFMNLQKQEIELLFIR